MPNKAIVIGAGFAGLAAACELATSGMDVTILEKNSQIGGRARSFDAKGFTFDMGPSWYWMPGVFETFFNRYDSEVGKHYNLVRLDPGFQCIISQEEVISVPSDPEQIYSLFESMEKGASGALRRFMAESKRKYDVAMDGFIYKPSHSIFEFATGRILKESLSMDLLTSFEKYVAKFFKDKRLQLLMEFPVLFLGAKPSKIPALYSMMNYSALHEGTWYPMGGMHQIIEGFADVARSLGVQIKTNSEVKRLVVEGKRIVKVTTDDLEYEADVVIGSADYHHIELDLLKEEFRNYDENYWDSRTMSPSCLIYYLGVNKKLPKLEHHNLFFDTDFEVHANEIYDDPQWPSDPQFYVCCPSKTDPTIAPEGKENLFLLMPIAPGIEDDEQIRIKYRDVMLDRIEKWTGVEFREDIIFEKSYCLDDFSKDYHAYKGNAYGLANTLNQTAIFKPKMKNKHISNLWYCGQLTVPGPGMPPSIISGIIAGSEVQKKMTKESKHARA